MTNIARPTAEDIRKKLITIFTTEQWRQILSVAKTNKRPENLKILKAWLGFLNFEGVGGQPTVFGVSIYSYVWTIFRILDECAEPPAIDKAESVIGILERYKTQLSAGQKIVTDIVGDQILERKDISFLKSNTDNRITQEFLKKQIAKIDYVNPEDTTVTICAVKLINGSVVTGQSGSLSKSNYSVTIGKKLAKRNAMDKLWELYGFAAKQKSFELSDESTSEAVLPWKFD